MGNIGMGVVLAMVLVSGWADPAMATPCKAYTVDNPDPKAGYPYDEVNNCPPLRGVFTNRDWQVQVQLYEPAEYLLTWVNRRTQETIQVMDFNVRGTRDRPQYRFRKPETPIVYVFTFRPANPNVVRVEIYNGNQRTLNQLLYRSR